MVAIDFQNISKQYKLGQVSNKTLVADINRFWNVNVLKKEDPSLRITEVNNRAEYAHSDYVWALKDVSFQVEQGESIAIIGKNGSGKSTLLKILSRITLPTTGCIQVNGQLASLLEVGTGFHYEMTGRENIYMNGAILGMKQLEIDKRLDEIIAFSGCERYIDTPIKRYSSGMAVRLGFAIAAHLNPSILVVDEVLAVGDNEFQHRAIKKLQEINQQGATILYVSHNIDTVLALCNKGVLLESGMLKQSGLISEIVELYQGL